MNKLLGNLSTTLFDPVVDGGGGGANGASVSTTPGRSVEAAPASENFYSSGAVEDGQVGGAAEVLDASDKGADKSADTGRADFVSLTDEQEPANNAAASTVVAPVAEVKPQVMKLDAETIAALRGQAAAAAPATQTSPKLSPQQLKEMLNPVEVSPATLQAMGFENPSNEQVAGFQNFANAVTKNAVSIARVMIQQARKEVEGIVAPLSQQHQQSQQDALKNSFYGSNKDLSKYEKIVAIAAKETSQFNLDGSEKSPEALMKEVADKARATLKEYGINLSAPANLGTAAGEQVPKPNRLSSVGRSGGDTNGQRGKPNNADADIYKR